MRAVHLQEPWSAMQGKATYIKQNGSRSPSGNKLQNMCFFSVALIHETTALQGDWQADWRASWRKIRELRTQKFKEAERACC